MVAGLSYLRTLSSSVTQSIVHLSCVIFSYIDFYQGYYSTMDSGCCDENGYISVLSRSDDVINVAGHRLSAGALEEVTIFLKEK